MDKIKIDMEKLSICIPTYKRLDYLKTFVETIPEKYHVCISDNGNFIPDNFFERGNIKIKHIDDVVPMYANWNSAIDMVETEWFIIPGDDDIVKPSYLPLIEKYINQYQDCAYLAFAYDVIDENGSITGGWKPEITQKFNKVEGFRYIQRSVPFRWPSIVINTNCSKSVENFDVEFDFTAADSLYLQTMAIKYPIAVINENVGQYRVWSSGFTNLRIFSTDWFEKIHMWQQKLDTLLIKENVGGIDLKKLHDQAMCDNLNCAISMNKQKNAIERLKLVTSVGWPWRCDFINQLRLLKNVLL